MFRKLLLIFPVLLLGFNAAAGSGDVRVDGFFGHNVSYGVFGGTDVSASWSMPSWFELRGAMRYSSFPKYTADVRPAVFYDLPFGRLSLEAMAHYSYQSTTHDVCAGLAAGLRLRWMWVCAGYYYRTFLSSGDKLVEPVNLMYELGFSCLPDIEDWNLRVIVSNSRLARLERFYQPSLCIEGEYLPMDNLGVILSVESKRAGVFNIASDHFQCMMSIGVRYIW